MATEKLKDHTYKSIFNAFFDEFGMVQSQLDPYNAFIDGVRVEILNSSNIFEIMAADSVSEEDRADPEFDSRLEKYRVAIEFFDPSFRSPIEEAGTKEELDPIYPHRARMDGLAYNSPLYAKMRYTITPYYKDHSIGAPIIKEIRDKNEGRGEKLGYIPVMIKSQLCNLYGMDKYSLKRLNEDPYDHGGYFIVKGGQERVFVAQERRVENKIIMFKNDEDKKFSVVAEIQSIKEKKQERIASIKVKMESKKDTCFVTMSGGFKNKDIPLVVMFRLLGILTDREIIDLVIMPSTQSNLSEEDRRAMFSLLRKSLTYQRDYDKKRPEVLTIEQAVDYIYEQISTQEANQLIRDPDRKRARILTVLDSYLFPHIRFSDSKLKNYKKAQYLAYMVRKVLLAKLNMLDPDDRDAYANKRISSVGAFLLLTFKFAFAEYCEALITNISRDFSNRNIFKKNPDFDKMLNYNRNNNTIETRFRNALMSASFKPKRKDMVFTIKNGFQVYQYRSRLDTLSHTRRVSITLESKNNKLPTIRRLFGSHYGYLCSVETPEGEQVGLTKSIAVTCLFTVGSLPDPILKILKSFSSPRYIPFEASNYEIRGSSCPIFVNGDWVGNTYEPEDLVDELRERRRKMEFDPYISISYVYSPYIKEIRILTEEGRCVRPLYVVDRDTKQLRITAADYAKLDIKGPDAWTFSDLVLNGFVEYIDQQEQYNTLIAMWPSDIEKNPEKQYTHCELHPIAQMGVVANMIPLPDMNQSPRNLFQTAMAKQALDVYNLTYYTRPDTNTYILHSPERPMVEPYMAGPTHADKFPNGQNIMLAFQIYTGYNQEDAIIINKSSIERGLFHSTTYKVYKDEVTVTQQYRKPDPDTTVNMSSRFNYEKLNQYGLVPEETKVEKNDVLIGKIVQLPKSSRSTYENKNFRDESIAYKEKNGVIDMVIRGHNNESIETRKVKVRRYKIPDEGDKFAARSSQKGTCGFQMPGSDVFFTESGQTPDLIVNSHAIPSRMTMGQAEECVLALLGALKGELGDGTAFSHSAILSVYEELEKTYKIQYKGKQVCYNGLTGEKIQTLVFLMPCYYQRLKHMVSDKTHSRSSGPRQILTRQPLDGRSRDGGHRFGEMERDSLIAHGAMKSLAERFYDASDKFMVYICTRCGFEAISAVKEGIYYCMSCKKDNVPYSVVKTKMAFSTKLVCHLIRAMGISMKFETAIVN